MKTFWSTTVLVATLLGGSALLRGAEKPPVEHVKAMKELSAFLQAMTKPGAEQNLDEAKRWVLIVRDAFAVAGNFWNDRNQAGEYNAEIAATQEGIKEASDMGVSANLDSPEGVAASVKAIATHCQGCHAMHREKADDGSFLIK